VCLLLNYIIANYKIFYINLIRRKYKTLISCKASSFSQLYWSVVSGQNALTVSDPWRNVASNGDDPDTKINKSTCVLLSYNTCVFFKCVYSSPSLPQYLTPGASHQTNLCSHQ